LSGEPTAALALILLARADAYFAPANSAVLKAL